MALLKLLVEPWMIIDIPDWAGANLKILFKCVEFIGIKNPLKDHCVFWTWSKEVLFKLWFK